MLVEAASFVATEWSIPTEQFRVVVDPLCGGLESVVGRATVSYESPAPWPTRFVIKQLKGSQRREAAVYRDLWSRYEQPPIARLLGTRTMDDSLCLYLENVECESQWPWADTQASARVCRALARLHDSGFACPSDIDWDYEAELIESAQTTLAAALQVRDAQGKRFWSRPGDLRRVVEALAPIRSELLDQGALFIHGDVHPGNVMIRSQANQESVVLIDWARARVGSPLEDVASWLHSLGCWVPEARRRHDFLLRTYLQARLSPQPLNAQLRRRYWLASACNGLAGAIRYHLWVLSQPELAAASSYQALVAWQRVIRQAAALLATSSAR